MNQMHRRHGSKSFQPARRSPKRQRSWLNGFFVGLLSARRSGTAVAGAGRRRCCRASAGDGDDGEAPWHDQTMPIAERMKLAEGRPLRRRMMAAMAQQDCGQCGYNCNDYSDAIATQERGAAQSVRPRRQGNRADAEGAARGTGKGARRRAGRTGGPAAGAARAGRRGAGPLARQSGAGDVRVAPSAEQDRVGKGNLAHRLRSRRLRPRLCRRRFLRHLRPQRSRPCRSDHRACSAPRTPPKSAAKRCARS